VLTYFRNDERPSWAETIVQNGETDDYSSGYTFKVSLATSRSATPVLTKTSGITGATGGVVTVAWASGELDLAPARYLAHLTVTRTSDGAELTIEETIEIVPRLT
jgi:hypothetical protein